MDDTFEKKEHAKNIYVIKHKLSELKRPPHQAHFEWQIGPFVVKIHLPDSYRFNNMPEFITQYEKVHVTVFEFLRRADGDQEMRMISLNGDSRFDKYKPIMYNTHQTPTGSTLNFSDGHDMPIIHLCELIRYLHRLANLTAFM